MTTPRVAVPSSGQWINLGGAAHSFSALVGSLQDGTGAIVMTAGGRPPLALRILFEVGDAEGWSGVHTGGRTSNLLLRVLS